MALIDACSQSVKVRPLDRDEIGTLPDNAEVLVPSPDFMPHTDLLECAQIVDKSKAFAESDRVRVRTDTGVETSVRAVYVPSQDGEEKRLFRDAGSRVSMTLFIPELSEVEAVQRVRKALRDEFGAGVVEVWNTRSGPVRDIRWDVYEVRRDLVSVGPKPKRGRAPEEWREVERSLMARGVRDGHQHHFMGKERKGWSLHVEVHDPALTNIDTI